jgi:hypothetical protein
VNGRLTSSLLASSLDGDATSIIDASGDWNSEICEAKAASFLAAFVRTNLPIAAQLEVRVEIIVLPLGRRSVLRGDGGSVGGGSGVVGVATGARGLLSERWSHDGTDEGKDGEKLHRTVHTVLHKVGAAQAEPAHR